MPRYALPADTVEHVERQVSTCAHLGLLIEKYVPLDVLKAYLDDGSPPAGSEDARYRWMQEVAKQWNRAADGALWEQANARWQATAASLGATTWTMTLADRLVVGLGHNTVLETGLTIHHTWGLPYLPGSALKGLARAWATLEDLSEREPVFGSVPQQTPLTSGKVVFLDALPLAGAHRPHLAVDIMNPHYADYYRDPTSPPAAYLNPIPVFFLIVEGGTWRFGVAPRRGVPPQQAAASLPRARAWLSGALEHMGAGGKTSAGYGFFQPAPAEPAPPAGVRTALRVLRVDTNRNAYRVEPRADALARIAEQHGIPLAQLRDTATRWYLPLDAFTARYGNGATTGVCLVDHIEREAETLMIWMKAAPRTTGGNT